MMKITILGCGTSTGVPVIGCDCPVCSSKDPRNDRTRASILVSSPGGNLLVDTSTDLRAQALRNSIRRIDAVLFTHHHADHIHGIDELRIFNKLQQEEPIPCFSNTPTIKRVTEYLEYIFAEPGSKNNGWKPNLSAEAIEARREIAGTEVTPVRVSHGSDTILGFRINDLAYLTDCSSIPTESMELLRGVEVLIIGALRNTPHPSHFSISEAVEAATSIGAGRTILTHLGHSIDYAELNPTLPDGVELAYDSMVIEL